jgi:Phospholipase_D-nuclease N-terminal
MLAASYPLLDAFWTILWIFLFTMWIWLVIYVFMDIFRSHDLSGVGKAGWSLVVIFLPLFGVLLYLIARGGSMEARREREAEAQQTAMNAYIRDVADNGSTSKADEVAKLADLHERHLLSDAEFEQAKSEALRAS